MNSTNSTFEIIEEITFNFTTTNKNILFQNLLQEAIEDLQNYAISKGYIKDNNVIISDYYPTNESRLIINPEYKLYQVQIPDSRFIENSSADKSFIKDIVDGKYKHLLIHSYYNFLFDTITGEIIFQTPKDKMVADEENLKTSYYNFTLESKVKNDPSKKLKVFLVQRIKAMIFVKNPDINKNKTVNHKDRNRRNNNIDNLECQSQKVNNNEKGDIKLPSIDLKNDEILSIKYGEVY
jgi:hypothetical protein